MPKITYIEHNGTKHVVDAETGISLMEAARMNDVPSIEGECGGSCACATCHVFINKEWLEVTGAASAGELELLEMLDERSSSSRLSCQIDITDAMDGLVVTLPETQG